MMILGQTIPAGSYTLEKPFTFVTEKGGTYGGQEVEGGSKCEFFETKNWEFLLWKTPDGFTNLAKEYLGTDKPRQIIEGE